MSFFGKVKKRKSDTPTGVAAALKSYKDVDSIQREGAANFLDKEQKKATAAYRKKKMKASTKKDIVENGM